MIRNKQEFIRKNTHTCIKNISQNEKRAGDLFVTQFEVQASFDKTSLKKIFNDLGIQVLKINTSKRLPHYKATAWVNKTKKKIALVYSKESINTLLNKWENTEHGNN